MSDGVLLAFGLSLLAGGSTAIGSALALFRFAASDRTLAGALGFSAGVMVYVSFVELMVDAREELTAAFGATRGEIVAVVSFFAGVLVIALIDRLVPEAGNPHEYSHAHIDREPPDPEAVERRRRMMRIGVLSAVAIAIHNFPEGLATFASALHDPDVGVAVAVAVGIHNVPEGIAVSLPMLHATGSPRKAFLLASASGLAEPLGAIIGWSVLGQLLGPLAMGIVLAGVAGIMVFISFDQLLPAAEEFGEHHIAVYGLVGGMAVMALTLVLV